MQRFRLYPLRTGGKFFEARIYGSQRAMEAAIKPILPEATKRRIGDRCLLALTFLKVPTPRLRNVGTVFLFKGELSPRVVAHEIDHAVTMFIGEYEPKERRRIYTDPEQDEFRALMVDWMHDQFWTLVQA